jgi:hypothetical protein
MELFAFQRSFGSSIYTLGGVFLFIVQGSLHVAD